MLARKTFGKLGKRSMARLVTALDASMTLPDRTARCHIENLSRNGCRIELTEPPRLGATVLMRIDRIEAIGTVAWVRGLRCGIKFANAVPVSAIERVRWIAENESDHVKSKVSVAGAVWR
jgi:hypothetical protein